jgi:hypothetical protein
MAGIALLDLDHGQGLARLDGVCSSYTSRAGSSRRPGTLRKARHINQHSVGTSAGRLRTPDIVWLVKVIRPVAS